MNQLLLFKAFRYRSSLLPISKSLFNRLIFILSFINRSTIIRKPPLNIDTTVMINSLIMIGKCITIKDSIIIIKGNTYVRAISDYFNFKNSGITARIISLLLLFKTNIPVILDGNNDMKKRPLFELIDIYSLFCITPKFCFLGKYGFLPIRVSSTPKLLLRNTISIRSGLSSQFLTSLILNIPLFYNRDITIYLNSVTSLSYIYMTVSLMRSFGVNITINDSTITYISSNYTYNDSVLNFIEGDYSSFSYIIFSYFSNRRTLYLKYTNLSSIQSEIKFIKVFNAIGYMIRGSYRRINFRRSSLSINSICVDCSVIIDTSMIIPIFVFYGLKRVKLYNVYNWNFKESRRIYAIVRELKKLGCFVKYGKNWIKVLYLVNIRGVFLDTYRDHRVFMSFFPLIFYSSNIAICNPNNIKKTYPMFLRNERYKN
ncbi:hypothetical protein [Candidatus Vidania fulgoroideorum]